jgi:hypothetical protein
MVCSGTALHFLDIFYVKKFSASYEPQGRSVGLVFTVAGQWSMPAARWIQLVSYAVLLM